MLVLCHHQFVGGGASEPPWLFKLLAVCLPPLMSQILLFPTMLDHMAKHRLEKTKSCLCFFVYLFEVALALVGGSWTTA